MIQRLLVRLLAVSSLALGLGLAASGVATAQTLTAEPWPPQNARSALVAQNFKPNALVTLTFNAPVPTRGDGTPVPAAVKTDAGGGFRLELKLPEVRLGVTAAAGTQTASLRRDAIVQDLIADGTTVIAKEGDHVAARYYLSGKVKSVERSLGGFRAAVTQPSGLEESFNLENGKVVERVVFAPSPELLHTLEAPTYLKTAVPDRVAYWRGLSERDPTNPFLLLELWQALRAGGDPSAAGVLTRSLEVNAPFYVLVRLAARLEALKQPELAQNALERAKRGYLAAGYDPGFPVSKAALAAWGDPLGVARRLFAAQNPVRAAAWLEFVRAVTPRFPGYGVVYGEYASFLDGQSRSSEASDWRGFSNELDAGTTFTLGDQAYPRLEALGRLGLVVAVVCFLLLQFVLLLKYYPQQTRDLARFGGRFAATSRVPLLRLRLSLPGYQTITEKLIAVILLSGGIGALGVWQYASHAQSFLETPAFSQGTAGGADYFQALSLVPAPGSAYLNGLGLQLGGDSSKALEAYRNAPSVAGAANNIGTILKANGNDPGAQVEFTRAASLESDNLPARFNLGNAASGYRVAIHNAYRKGQPLLESYTPRQLVEFRFGSLEQEYLRMVADPWGYLTGLPLGLPDPLPGVVAVLVLAVLTGTVLWLFVPRVRTAHTAPRSFLYHLGAILIPGSGLADEVWGVILLLLSATIGGLLALDYFASSRLGLLFAKQRFLGIGNVSAWYDVSANLQWLLLALLAIFIVNFLGWLLETIAVGRRTRQRALASKTAPNPAPTKTP